MSYLVRNANSVPINNVFNVTLVMFFTKVSASSQAAITFAMIKSGMWTKASHATLVLTVSSKAALGNAKLLLNSNAANSILIPTTTRTVTIKKNWTFILKSYSSTNSVILSK